MESIVDLVSGALRGSPLDRLSSRLDESPEVVERGVEHATPLLVASFAKRAQSEQGAEYLVSRVRDDSQPQLEPSELGQVLSDPAAIQRTTQSSGGFLGGFFGNELNTILDMVTSASGLKRSSASTLVGLIAPLVLGWIGRNVKSRGLSAHGLSQWLADEGEKVSARVPAGFSSMFASGAGGPAPHETSAPRVGHAEIERSRQPTARKASAYGLPWLLVTLAALALVLVWGLRRGARDVAAPPISVAPEAERSERQPVAGTDLLVLRDDARQLQAFFQEEQGSVPQRFVLEGLDLDTASADIASNAMLDAAARTLAANPNARARLEGHTDNRGDEQQNQSLSQRRAEAVRSYLVRQGVRETQLSAVGMAARHPIADNDTPEGRAQNRRVELVVVQR